MADVLLRYQTVMLTEEGRTYRAWACGGEARDGTHRWYGWIEFLPLDGGPPVRTAHETTQPNRTATVYWSTGLSPVYLEGALRRARRTARIQSAASIRCDRTTARISATADARLELTPDDRRFLRSLGIATTAARGLGAVPRYG